LNLGEIQQQARQLPQRFGQIERVRQALDPECMVVTGAQNFLQCGPPSRIAVNDLE
jgi:hypothetical protein